MSAVSTRWIRRHYLHAKHDPPECHSLDHVDVESAALGGGEAPRADRKEADQQLATIRWASIVKLAF